MLAIQEPTVIKHGNWDFLLQIKSTQKEGRILLALTVSHFRNDRQDREMVFFYSDDNAATVAYNKMLENLDQTFNMVYHNLVAVADPSEW